MLWQAFRLFRKLTKKFTLATFSLGHLFMIITADAVILFSLSRLVPIVNIQFSPHNKLTFRIDIMYSVIEH
jgi:hypothetical protein